MVSVLFRVGEKKNELLPFFLHYKIGKKDNMESYDTIELNLTIVNQSQRSVMFYLEPWGEEYVLVPGTQVRVIGHGPKNLSTFVVEYGDCSIIVTAWKGSIVQLFENDRELGSIGQRPRVPEFL